MQDVDKLRDLTVMPPLIINRYGYKIFKDDKTHCPLEPGVCANGDSVRAQEIRSWTFDQWHSYRYQPILVAMRPEVPFTVAGALADKEVGVVYETLANFPFAERV